MTPKSKSKWYLLPFMLFLLTANLTAQNCTEYSQYSGTFISTSVETAINNFTEKVSIDNTYFSYNNNLEILSNHPIFSPVNSFRKPGATLNSSLTDFQLKKSHEFDLLFSFTITNRNQKSTKNLIKTLMTPRFYRI